MRKHSGNTGARDCGAFARDCVALSRDCGFVARDCGFVARDFGLFARDCRCLCTAVFAIAVSNYCYRSLVQAKGVRLETNMFRVCLEKVFTV